MTLNRMEFTPSDFNFSNSAIIRQVVHLSKIPKNTDEQSLHVKKTNKNKTDKNLINYL